MRTLWRAGSFVWRELREARYAAKMKRSVTSASSQVAPNRLFGGISDDYWFWLNTEGRRRSAAVRETLPGLPDEKTQAHFTGAVGDVALREGFRAYVLFKQLFETHGSDSMLGKTVLDFGCGWGRIIRFFLKDVEPSKLWGVDALGEMIDVCARTNRWCHFKAVDTLPPTDLPSESFNLIYAYSVFSHLSEDVHTRWLAEFRRLLKPQGLLIVTTRDRAFIKRCENLRSDKNLTSYPDWVKRAATAFPDARRALEDYDAGRYCFTAFGRGEWSFFGEAAISRGYVLKHWARYVDVLAYIDNRNLCPQNVVVGRKLL